MSIFERLFPISKTFSSRLYYFRDVKENLINKRYSRFFGNYDTQLDKYQLKSLELLIYKL